MFSLGRVIVYFSSIHQFVFVFLKHVVVVDSTLVLINAVALHQSRLLLGWVRLLTCKRVTLNNAAEYRTDGLYWTPNPNPSPLAL